jgi:hypothetical protein
MPKVEVLYPFGTHRRGDVVEVPEDKVGALRRLRWAREIENTPPAAKPAVKAKARKAKEKEPDIDAVLSEETEARLPD